MYTKLFAIIALSWYIILAIAYFYMWARKKEIDVGINAWFGWLNAAFWCLVAVLTIT